MRQHKQRGVTLMIGTMSLIFLVPLIGLGIDVGFLFAVKSKLQGAVDGASLAAARALNLGQTTTAQQGSALSHANNWFAANFPTGYFGTHNTVVDSNCTPASNCVFNDPSNPNLQHVVTTASTQVDTFFMKWFGISYTTVAATSDATRRDVVAMMVLDRSGSMNTGSACPSLVSAAKIFTGQFAAGRDYIGAVSYSDGPYLHSAPTTSFQTVLGYTNDSGSASGQLDNIVCNGGTGTPGAIAIAYDQLYKMNLPGALNIIMFETDGLPNTMVFNWWDNTNTLAGLVNSNNSNCTDKNGKTVKGGGFTTAASIPSWTSGHTMASTAYSNVPAGIVGAMYSGDPWQEAGGWYFSDMFNPWQTTYSQSSGNGNSTFVTGTAPGCQFSGGFVQNVATTDLAWVPLQDVYGNQMNPTNPFAGAVTTTAGSRGTGTYLKLTAPDGSTDWNNYHSGVLNATDNAAYQVRTNGTLPATIFGIGLGGNCTPNCTASGRTGDPPDYVLMQRMANDPNGDLFNTPANYSSCALESNCVYYAGQPQGTFIFSSNKTQLTQAFLSISSQVLRLNH